MKLLLLAFTSIFIVQTFASVRILTFHYNQAEFIEVQYKALQKFLRDDFELIVFNDANALDNEKAIEHICCELGIKCVRFEQQWHNSDPLNSYLKSRLGESTTVGIWGWNAMTTIEEIASNPSVRHSHVIQYALENYGYDHDDIVVIMDGDNFIIKPISIRKLLTPYDLIGFNQIPDHLGINRKKSQASVPKTAEMFWVVFIAFNPRTLPSPRDLRFNVDVIDNFVSGQNVMGDTGAAVHKYLRQHPDLKLCAFFWQDSGIFREYFNDQELKQMGFDDRIIQFIKDIHPGNVQFFVFEHFLHFSAFSARLPDHDHKIHYLRKYMNEILSEDESK